VEVYYYDIKKKINKFLIDKNLFNLMKLNDSIINTARGGVANETDLLCFLKFKCGTSNKCFIWPNKY
jgi:phosphoglycerate dehydrogenase-like enzyme